ncbi:MAG: hypothetical protein LBN05_04245 [Oscillospiraceae bacterium]|jgi:hypothetical protein|nr:hypothetical protein [Oscillospiraceae bacterium]
MKRIVVSLLCIALLLGSLNACVIVPGSREESTTPDPTTVPTTTTAPPTTQLVTTRPPVTTPFVYTGPAVYRALLREYHEAVYNALRGNGRKRDTEVNTLVFEISYWESLNDVPPGAEMFGYAIEDINHDGVDELVIMSKNYNIVGLYAVVKNQATVVELFTNRFKCKILADGTIYIAASSGAMDNENARCILRKDALYVLDAISSQSGVKDEANGVVFHKTVEDKKKKITEEQYEKALKDYPSWGYVPERKTTTCYGTNPAKESGLRFIPIIAP